LTIVITALANLIISNTYKANADINDNGNVNAAGLVLITNIVNKKLYCQTGVLRDILSIYTEAF
jgi:hypothetical protein